MSQGGTPPVSASTMKSSLSKRRACDRRHCSRSRSPQANEERGRTLEKARWRPLLLRKSIPPAEACLICRHASARDAGKAKHNICCSGRGVVHVVDICITRAESFRVTLAPSCKPKGARSARACRSRSRCTPQPRLLQPPHGVTARGFPHSCYWYRALYVLG